MGQVTSLWIGDAETPVRLERASGAPPQAVPEVRWSDGNEGLFERSEPPRYAGPSQSVETGLFDKRYGVTSDSGDWVDLTELLALIDERYALRGVEVVTTVSRGTIPVDRVRDCHLVMPADGLSLSRARLAALYCALRTTSLCMVVRWPKDDRQALGAIYADPFAGCLKLVELEWEASMRDVPPGARVGSFQVNGRAVEAMADALREFRHPAIKPFDCIRDERAVARTEALEVARRGEMPEMPEVPPVRQSSRGARLVVDALVAVM